MRLKHSFFLSLVIFLVASGCGAPTRTTPYVIARNPSWEQLNLYGTEKNISGFTDDLLFEIAKDQKMKIRLITSSRAPLVGLLDQDGVDAVISATTPTEENSRLYLFSEPLLVLGPVLVVQQNSPYTSVPDLAGKEIGFERTDSSALMLTDSAKAIFRPYDGAAQAFEDLINGRIDGVIVNAIIAHRLASNVYQGDVRILTPPLAPIGIRLVVKKGKSEELVALFNQGLAELKKEAFYQKILLYWSLFDLESVQK